MGLEPLLGLDPVDLRLLAGPDGLHLAALLELGVGLAPFQLEDRLPASRCGGRGIPRTPERADERHRGRELAPHQGHRLALLAQLRSLLASRGVTLHISGIKLPVEQVLRRAGALQESPLLQMYRTDTDALHALASLEKTQGAPA